MPIDNLIFNMFDYFSDAILIIDINIKQIIYSNKVCLDLFKLNNTNKLELDNFIKNDNKLALLNRIERELEQQDVCILKNLTLSYNDLADFHWDIQAGYTSKDKSCIYLLLKNNTELENIKNFKNIISNSPDPSIVIKLNKDLNIIYTNDEFENNFSTRRKSFKDVYSNNLINAIPVDKCDRYLSEIYSQVTESRKFSLEIILLDAVNREHVVLFSGVQTNCNDVCSNTSEMYCTLRIIDDKIKQITSLESENTFFQAIQSFSSDLLFKVNIQDKSAKFFGNVQDEIEVPPVVYNYPHGVIERNQIHKDDEKIFLNFAKNMFLGVEDVATFRMRSRGGEFLWYKSEYIVSKQLNDIPLEAIGKITNVQETKLLEEQVNIDNLTGCLSKRAFEVIVSNILENTKISTRHAMLIIDVDNFKAVNDNLGHQFGDIVLKEVGEGLRNLFRDTDYVGRIGGDEFMVLIKDMGDIDTIQKKCNQILQLLDTSYQGNERTYKISGSIGISISSQDGVTFKELYNNADIALYESKHRGKNSYTFYTNDLSKGTMVNTTPFDIASRTLSQYFDQEIVINVFNLLFESKDFEVSLQAVLKLLGSRFNASRCYIFESFNPDYYTNTYEWCKNGINPEISNSQCIDKSVFENFHDLANSDGVLYCNDLNTFKDPLTCEIMEMQNIKSFLHTYMVSDGKIVYVLGFDDCESTRVWSPLEISTLMYSTKIIAQFLSYKRDILKINNLNSCDK